MHWALICHQLNHGLDGKRFLFENALGYYSEGPRMEGLLTLVCEVMSSMSD